MENSSFWGKLCGLFEKLAFLGVKFVYFRLSMQDCKKMEESSLWKTRLPLEIFCKAIDFQCEIGYNGIAKRMTRRL